MKKTKQLLSFFLVLCMLMTYIPTPMVYASGEKASLEKAFEGNVSGNHASEEDAPEEDAPEEEVSEENTPEGNTPEGNASEEDTSEENAPEEEVSLENASSGSTFSSGSGTEDDPYIIANADDFKKLAEDVNGGTSYEGIYFKVSNAVSGPISLSSADGFVPIGTESNPFKGIFDGNDKTVELDLALPDTNKVGLFGFCSLNSLIKNVTTTGSVTGRYYVGGIVGTAAGNITNCQNGAAVTGDKYVGGITGRASNYVINCSNSGPVSGSSYVGGIVSHMSTTKVTNCLNTGSVTGGQNTGGIAGYVWSGEIRNCVNNGAVEKTDGSTYAVGGIAGMRHNSYLTITNGYYNDTINEGIYDAGYDTDNVAITTKICAVSGTDIVTDTVLDALNIYADKNKVNGTALLYWQADGNVISLTSTKPDIPYTITNNSDAYITVDSCARNGETVTITVSEPSGLAVTGVTVKDANGEDVAITQTETGYTFTMPESDVTVSATADIKLTQENGVYQIRTADEMKILSDAVNNGYDTTNKSFLLTSNVSLSSADGFVPIGTDSNPFKGIFDGNDKTVELDLALPDTNKVGLFGYCYLNSVIKNVTTTGTVSGSKNVGGIVGFTNGTMINCHNQAAVSGSENVGGIVGGVDHYVINCLNSGAVSGSKFVGGIIGYMNGAQVTNCLNTGSVTGTEAAGGIVGYAWARIITNCVNNGKVIMSGSSSYECGGIAGMLRSAVSLTNCYYNQTINAEIYDGGHNEYFNSITATNCAVSGTDIVTDTVLDVLNIYADKNQVNGTALLYWQADGNVISLTSTKPDIPYTITNNSDAYITVDSYARNGETVTITVSEPSGLAVTGVTVKDGNNDSVAITQTETGYTFTMPESDVTVSATAEIKLTQENGVYQISSADEMKILSDAVNNGYDTTNKSFLLTSNVSLSSAGGFAPIGTDSNPFKGIFDGNDKTVELDLALPDTNDVGLFGFSSRNSVIKNVTTTGSVTGRNYVGGIVGTAAGNIINCQNGAAVTGGIYVGGITGYPTNYVINCSNSGPVSGSNEVGGIVGHMSTARVINCLNTGSVTGGQNTGGIAGYAWTYEITNCVNNGAVQKTDGSAYAVGGIAGMLRSGVTLTNGYYNKNVNAEIYDAGYDESNATITTTDCAVSGNDIVSYTVLDALNIYAKNNQVNGTALLYWHADGDVISLTSEAPSLLYAITNNSDADITVDSYARNGETVTITASEPSYLAVTGVTVKDANGEDVAIAKTETGYTFTMPESDVTVSATADIKLTQENGVYQISSADEMKILSDAVNNGYDTTNKSFLLTSNVSLSSADGFAPIGTDSKRFRGTFDGNGKTVELDLNLPDTNNVGLFGYCGQNSVIKNVTTTGSVTGRTGVGGIVGTAAGNIINCQNGAAVTGGTYVGGITGYPTNYVINCSNSGPVSGSNKVGGIVGHMSTARVINCLNTGSVTGGENTGGIAGYAWTYEITNCVNNGAVQKTDGSTYAVGGIAGMRHNSYLTITNGYYNETINADVYDAGYDKDKVAITTTNCAVSGTDIVSDAVLDVLNIYADNNQVNDTELLYWQADGNVISLTSTKPDIPYLITNKSDYLTVADGARSGASVEITVDEIPSYLKLVKITVNGEELSKNAEGKYVFTMPERKVTVEAETAFALTELSDGSYAISTAEELAIFAKAVNSGEFSNVSATLTADITVSTDDGFEPIGTYGNPYGGKFYGGGHTLTLQITEGAAYDDTTVTGLFGAVERAYICDLILKGSVDGGDKTDSYTGALIGVASGSDTYVYNVYSEVAVRGSGYVGGIVGNGNTYAWLCNVVNNGTVTQKNTADEKKAVGGIMGVGNSDYLNVYYNSEKNSGMYDCGYDASLVLVTSNDDSVMAKTTAELFADEVMDALNLYALGSGSLMFWDISADTQTVKLVEKCPVAVYEILPANDMSGKCITVPFCSRAGKTITVKTNLDTADEWMIKGISGIKVTDSTGTVIGVNKTADSTYEFVMPEKDVSIQVLLEYDITTDSDGVYCIENAEDLFIFSRIVAEGQTDAKAKVTAKTIDINNLSDVDFTPDGLIGQNTAYKGVFDGNGAQISWNGALFGKTDGAVIKNISISTVVFASNQDKCAGVVKNAKNTHIDNCNVGIIVSARFAGGIVGEAVDSVITNCSVTASGGSEAFGGMVAAADNTVVANCVLNESDLQAAIYGGIVLIAQGETKIYNCANQDVFNRANMLLTGGIVSIAEMSGLTLTNNFYYKANGCYDVCADYENNGLINAMTDEDSAVDEDAVKALYISARLNEFIEDHPGIIEGITLHKWSNHYDSETDSNAACFVDEKHPEIYSIKQSDIKVSTLVSGNSVYGAATGAEVTVSGVPGNAQVTVTAENGNEVALTDTYTFTMPACNVTVSVVMDSGIEETTVIDGKTYVVVKTAEDFIKAVTSIAAGNNILNVYIGADIALTSEDLVNYPAYADNTPAYNGTFDGAGHAVTFDGLTSAMLATIGEKGVVKNLTVAGSINGGELPAAAVAYVNMGTILNCINQAQISGSTVAGIALSNEFIICNCINKGEITGSVSAAITYMNQEQGMVGMVANEGTINNPSENGKMIAIGNVGETCIDLSEVTDKSKWKECAAQFNDSLESIKAQMESGSNDTALQALKEALEWSVSGTDTGAKLVFADEENAPYYMCTTPDGNKPYQAGDIVEVKFDSLTLEEGFVIGSVTVQAEYANEKFSATPVSGKKDTFSFQMPRKTCKIAMKVEPTGLKKDEDGYYLVGTLDDLTKVKKTMEYGNDDINVKLTADINGYDGTPIGGAYGYDGIFDGNGHSITLAMLEESGSYRYYGFFGILQSNAVVKNLTIKGSIQVNNSEFVGAVAGKCYGTVTDCVNNADVTNNNGYAGGIVGSSEGDKNSPAKLSNCVNNGKIKGYDAGGIVCDIVDYSVITNCENTGEVTATNDDAGGIATQGRNVEIINCVNTGAVSGYYAGGVMSYLWDNCVINNCINNGAVDAVYSAGGIVGYGEDNMTVRNCFNSGTVTGDDDVYAIAYYDYGKNGIILNSFYLQTEDVNAGLTSSNLAQEKDSSKAVTEALVTSGYVAYHLRSGQAEGETVFWGQTLSGENADAQPVLGGKPVYRNETYKGCEGKPGAPTYSYSNKQEETVYAPHNYEESQDGSYHECTICHEKEQHSDVAKYTVNETEHSISASCDGCGNLGTITLSAPTKDLTYTGTAKAAAVSGSIKGMETPEIIYSTEDKKAPANAGTYRASISLTDADGKIYTVSVTYQIEQATPDVKALPTVDDRTYAQGTVLVSGDLKGGTVNGIDGKTLPGTWNWKKTDIVPKADNKGYVAIFKPVDTVNYQTIEKTISVNVSKAKVAPNKPGSTMNTGYTSEIVGKVTLPEGWVWKDADKTKALEVGKAVTATAIYNGADKGNYETESVEISITRLACTHTWDDGKVTKEATPAEKGVRTYTCTVCKTTRTEEIPALGAPAVGTIDISDDGTATYKITTSGLTKGTVTYVAPTDKKVSTVSIPATVTIDGIIYKVTAIADKAFANNKKITKVTIGNNITTIGKQAFYKCTKLKTVKIGKNVTTISDKAFYKCTSLTKITIPSKVKKIGKQAFYGCKKLKSITIKTTKLTSKNVGSKAFKGIYSKATIKVPKKKLTAYKKLLKSKGLPSKGNVKGY